MNPEQLAGELADGTLRPCYLLLGDEPLLRQDAIHVLRAAVLGEGGSDFDLDRLAAERVDAGALEDSLNTLPVLAPRRLVILEEPEGRRAKGVSDALPDLLAGLADGAGSVLVVTATKADKRSRWVKAFGKSVVDCNAPTRARDIAAFVRREAERQEVVLGRGVAELLAERVGPQLLLLRSEIAKLALFAGPGAKIQKEHVASGTASLAEAPIWDLTDAIGEGRTAEALRVLATLQAAGAPGPVILGSLVSHFRKLLRVGHGASVAAPPFVRKKLESQARRYGARRLRSSLDAIHQTDLALKGAGGLRPDLALERLVLALGS
ncbi:MAG: DNA polymerase III subunit delta [Myxococcota bacterium]